MKILTATLAAALLAAPLFAADATGKWEASVPGPRGDLDFVFDLSADGESLTGTVSNERMGESEITDGKVDGDTVSFKQKVELGPREVTFSYSGTIDGDEMELTRTVEGGPGRGGPGGGEGRRGPRAEGEGGGPPAGGQGVGRGEGRGRGGRGGGMGREVTFTAKRM